MHLPVNDCTMPPTYAHTKAMLYVFHINLTRIEQTLN
jgi:hypothetical protein